MCERYSIACGADFWLEFDETDPPEYQDLNGKCIVVVGHIGNDKVITDEDDPFNPSQKLIVSRYNLRN